MVCPPKGVHRTTWFEACGTPRNFQVYQLVDAAPASNPLRFRCARSVGTRPYRDPLLRKLTVSAASRGPRLPSSSATCVSKLTRGARHRRTSCRLVHGSAFNDPHSSRPLQEAPLMLLHLAPAVPLVGLAGTGGFARAMHQRVSHGQQNAHRRLPPGRNPGGCAPR
jgi:hypothetical protein